jgi:hypothetical protein
MEIQMKHRARLDEAREILHISFAGSCNSLDLKELCDCCQRFLNGYSVSKAAIDLSEIESFPDEEVRKQLLGQLRRAGVSKVAIICSRPEVKMVGITLMQYLKKYTDAEFFSSKDEALEWLENSKAGSGGEVIGEAFTI